MRSALIRCFAAPRKDKAVAYSLAVSSSFTHRRFAPEVYLGHSRKANPFDEEALRSLRAGWVGHNTFAGVAPLWQDSLAGTRPELTLHAASNQ